MEIRELEEAEVLIDFLNKTKNDFPISLDNKVDIIEYVNKLTMNGIVIGIMENESLEGIIGGYCNDFETKTAYISILIINKVHRGKGYSKKLLSGFIEKCYKNKMDNILVYTNHQNKEAIGLYESNGFIKCDEVTSDIKFLKKLEVA
ncbi:GNAT family N-acetyltransferase [Thomasclavelia cocleata]|uniref:GNAT family N-acetyltransferase n=1 Tax=Thomasclavelia cocleata TaxID=69824 RepID=UPI00242DCB95|nr:GNAT family N-acetyltransferase [Thomasclavelia cocleata]